MELTEKQNHELKELYKKGSEANDDYSNAKMVYDGGKAAGKYGGKALEKVGLKQATEKTAEKAGTEVAEKAAEKAGTEVAEKAGTQVAEKVAVNAGAKVATDAAVDVGSRGAMMGALAVGDCIPGLNVVTGVITVADLGTMVFSKSHKGLFERGFDGIKGFIDHHTKKDKADNSISAINTDQMSMASGVTLSAAEKKYGVSDNASGVYTATLLSAQDKRLACAKRLDKEDGTNVNVKQAEKLDKKEWQASEGKFAEGGVNSRGRSTDATWNKMSSDIDQLINQNTIDKTLDKQLGGLATLLEL